MIGRCDLGLLQAWIPFLLQLLLPSPGHSIRKQLPPLRCNHRAFSAAYHLILDSSLLLGVSFSTQQLSSDLPSTPILLAPTPPLTQTHCKQSPKFRYIRVIWTRQCHHSINVLQHSNGGNRPIYAALPDYFHLFLTATTRVFGTHRFVATTLPRHQHPSLFGCSYQIGRAHV